jgi:hypothetical protein
MIKFISALMLFLLISTTSCSDKCDAADSTKVASFFVELVDEETNENVFFNEMFSPSQIIITTDNEEDVPFRFLSVQNIIHIVPSKPSRQNNVIKIVLDNPETMSSREVEIHFDILKQKKECFTINKIGNVATPNHSYEFSDPIYQIKI